MGQKQKTEKERRERELVIAMAKLRMVHANTHGARKPPGPKEKKRTMVIKMASYALQRHLGLRT